VPFRSTGGCERGRVTLDMLFGAALFGAVGAAIGYYLGVTGSISIAAAIGSIFGFLIGMLGGRRFFVSIICGALMGGVVAWLLSGRDAVPLGAAMGGCIGVQMGSLIDLWRQREKTR